MVAYAGFRFTCKGGIVRCTRNTFGGYLART